ncbi:MAG: pyruvate dehydrogenase complex E1 component subunit beta [Alphaproteobacteria bacterium]|nr:pyruvate dehydrogenase complex E1 component subunit beta [Alphaproteobacteria bacterium]
MPTLLMPALSPTMTEGKLVRWLKAVGDAVRAGDLLAEVETDKAVMEIEAVDEGCLTQIFIQEGVEGVAVNTPIALILAEGENAVTPPAVTAAAPSASPPPNHMPNHLEESQMANNSAALRSQSIPAVIEEVAFTGATTKQTVRDALRDAMAEEMRADSTVFLMGEEVAEYQGAYKISQGLLQEFGAQRVIDSPITEHGFAGLGVGAAFGGLKPIIEFMTFNFAMQAIDQIINSAAKTLYMSGGQMGCPIVFRGPNGAASRVAAQHSQCYASWYAHCPGLKVVAPYSAADAKGLLKAAIRDPNPIIFLENEILYGQSFDDVPIDPDHIVPIGKARVARAGTDVTVTAYSIMVGKALEAAEQLAAEGISVEVIDLRTIRPLDIDTIVTSIKKTNRLISVEESWPVCGIGSELAAIAMEHAFDWLDAPVIRVAAEDVPLPYAANLEKLALPQVEGIVAAVKASLAKKS